MSHDQHRNTHFHVCGKL